MFETLLVFLNTNYSAQKKTHTEYGEGDTFLVDITRVGGGFGKVFYNYT